MGPQRVVESDVLVIGGGLAGIVAAITAAEAGVRRVTLVDKGRVGSSGQSTFAAGNWALKLPGDDDRVWLEETVSSGDYWADQHWVELLWSRNLEVTQQIIRWCAERGCDVFRRTESGEFVRRRSRGHIQTWHAMVDSRTLMRALREKASSSGVAIMDRVMVTDLVCDGGRCSGAVGLDYRSGQTCAFVSGQTVVAASGAAFKSTYVGHRNLTGDLQAAVWRAGGTLQNLENIAHNTTARIMDVHGMNQYQSVGGKWTNGLGQEFMPRYDPVLGNRCNQSTMALALAREVHEGRGPIWFDVTSATSEDQAMCRETLPSSFRLWDMAGVNPFEEKVEWISAFHGTTEAGGGVRIDLDCATGIQGLLAAGDVTCSPPQGGYAFGGVNLAFAAVSGRVAGETASRMAAGGDDGLPLLASRTSLVKALVANALGPLMGKRTGPDNAMRLQSLLRRLQEALVPYRVSLLKTKATLDAALDSIENLSEEADETGATDLHELVKVNELKNLCLLGRLMVEASLFREESRGYHFRDEYPLMDNDRWLKWVLVKREEGRIKLWTEEIPTPLLRPPSSYQTHRSMPRI